MSDPMTDAELQAIRERANAATPGPWYFMHGDDDYCMNCYGVTTDQSTDTPEEDFDSIIALTLYQSKRVVDHRFHKWDEDANFIAHARSDIPKLLAEVERLREAVPRLASEFIKETASYKERIAALEAEKEKLRTDLAYWSMYLNSRRIENENDRCLGCSGLGVRTYSSTAIWRGGIGGQAITTAVCDKCWGSGDASSPWVDLRRLLGERKALEAELATKDARIRELEAAGELSVLKFHQAFDVPIGGSWGSAERHALRVRLLEEEYNEYLKAEDELDLIEVADALSDMMVIIFGTAIEYGIPLTDVFREVMRSNMDKLDENGKPVHRDDGKVLKPAGWTPPDIRGVLSRKPAAREEG